ncbi:MAG: hypothetical protein HOP18_16870 [Deltaproteobacteria bacterium]|nr:hypothetical protein [Deltaproteobacteria bacterium]
MTRGTSRLFGISGLSVVALLSAVQSATAASRPTAVAPTTVEVSGQTQRLSEPTQIPDGLAKSDWQSIRAVYEAGRRASKSEVSR